MAQRIISRPCVWFFGIGPLDAPFPDADNEIIEWQSLLGSLRVIQEKAQNLEGEQKAIQAAMIALVRCFRLLERRRSEFRRARQQIRDLGRIGGMICLSVHESVWDAASERITYLREIGLDWSEDEPDDLDRAFEVQASEISRSWQNVGKRWKFDILAIHDLERLLIIEDSFLPRQEWIRREKSFWRKTLLMWLNGGQSVEGNTGQRRIKEMITRGEARNCPDNTRMLEVRADILPVWFDLRLSVSQLTARCKEKSAH